VLAARSSSDSRVGLGTVLASQALVELKRAELASWLDPFEVDVGRNQTGESADAEDGCLHLVKSRGLFVSD
jgi:hypothetical protein